VTDFTHTRKALEAYDAEKPRLDALMFESMTEEAVWAAVAAEKAEADKVREAFFQDTRHVNSRDHAALIGPNDPWVRRLIRPV
jgi:hypothetical protein